MAMLAYGKYQVLPLRRNADTLHVALFRGFRSQEFAMSGTFIAIMITLGVVVMVSLAVAVAVRSDGEPRHHDGS